MKLKRPYVSRMTRQVVKKNRQLNMRNSLTTAVLVVVALVSQSQYGANGSSSAAAMPKMVIAPKNRETDPMYIHSCALKQSPETLETLWTDLTKRILENTKYPGQLVRDMVDLACVQRNLYAYSDRGGRADLQMRFSNYMYTFIMRVVDNFKVCMESFLAALRADKAADLTHQFRATPARDILSLDPLLIASHTKSFRSERIRVHQAITEYVDVRVLIVARFVSAYPLLLHVASVLEDTNESFRGVKPKRLITPVPGSGAPRTVARPPSGAGSR